MDCLLLRTAEVHPNFSEGRQLRSSIYFTQKLSLGKTKVHAFHHLSNGLGITVTLQ